MTNRDLTLIIYIGILLIGRVLSQRPRRTGEIIKLVPEILEDPSAVAMAAAGLIAFAAPLLEAISKESHPINGIALIIGSSIMITGFLIVWLSNKAIAGNWSPSIEKTEQQQLVTKGPYSIIRHPLYFCGLLILIGTNIFFLNKWSWLSTLLAFMVTLFRIPIEEKWLLARFGSSYSEYRKKTRAIIPWIY